MDFENLWDTMCPPRSSNAKGENYPCQGKRCMWWVERQGCCAVKLIAMAADRAK